MIGALLLGDTAAVERAVAVQTLPPDQVVYSPGPLAVGLREVLATGTDWIWVLDGTAVPRPRSLGALVSAIGRSHGLQPPALLASVISTPAGKIAEPRAALFRRAPVEPAMVAAERRMLPVRAVTGPILIHRDAVVGERPPRPRLPATGALLEWTIRILRTRAGYLVPESESVDHHGHRNALLDPLTAAAVLLGREFSRGERLRVPLDLLEASWPRGGRPAA